MDRFILFEDSRRKSEDLGWYGNRGLVLLLVLGKLALIGRLGVIVLHQRPEPGEARAGQLSPQLFNLATGDKLAVREVVRTRAQVKQLARIVNMGCLDQDAASVSAGRTERDLDLAGGDGTIELERDGAGARHRRPASIAAAGQSRGASPARPAPGPT